MTNKITIAVLAITAILMSSCQLDTGNHFSEKESIYTVEEIEGRNGGGYVFVDDVIMLANSGNSLITIDRVDIYNNSGIYITTFLGCNSSECRINISSLSTGTYDAMVHLSTSSSFSAQFIMNN